MGKITLIPNAPILIESTRSIGYSFETALADIIDNSIAKNAKKIDVFFDSVDNPYVAVVDDGDGMNFEELKNAMRYGSQSSLDSRDDKDLGRFGLGLKTASLSQCRRLTVVSKKDGLVCAAIWDLDYITTTNDWTLLTYEGEECYDIEYYEYLRGNSSGTMVLWQEFDRIKNTTTHFQKSFDDRLSSARKHISLVFHRFMNDENPKNRIKIAFNNNELHAIDPFLVNNPSTQPLNEQTIVIEDELIKVKPYILPYPSKLTAKEKNQLGDISDLRKTQGFYIYRNKRLIIWGTWFKLIKSAELNKLARVRVDIPNSLDSIWNIDIKKSSASLPDSIKKNLIKIVENTVGKSEKVYKYRGRKVSSNDIMHTWNVIDDRGKYKYLINKDLPIYKELINHIDEDGERYLDSFIKMVENSFPFEDIYYRMSKDELKERTMEFEQVYNIGLDMISSVKSIGVDLKEFINSLKSVEFFIDYPDVIEKLLEDFSGE